MRLLTAPFSLGATLQQTPPQGQLPGTGQHNLLPFPGPGREEPVRGGGRPERRGEPAAEAARRSETRLNAGLGEGSELPPCPGAPRSPLSAAARGRVYLAAILAPPEHPARGLGGAAQPISRRAGRHGSGAGRVRGWPGAGRPWRAVL